jgi:hypothetical protein
VYVCVVDRDVGLYCHKLCCEIENTDECIDLDYL